MINRSDKSAIFHENPDDIAEGLMYKLVGKYMK